MNKKLITQIAIIVLTLGGAIAILYYGGIITLGGSSAVSQPAVSSQVQQDSSNQEILPNGGTLNLDVMSKYSSSGRFNYELLEYPKLVPNEVGIKAENLIIAPTSVKPIK